MGATLSVGLGRGYNRGLAWVEQRLPASVWLRIPRAALDWACTSFLMTSAHEIFGHGARLREFGLDALSYKLGILIACTNYPPLAFKQLSLQKNLT